MKFSVVRGTKDILPEEMEFWHHVESTSRSLFQLYNYHELRTPIFEESALFERSIGDTTDIVQKEMYSFTDKGGRNITLRPEGTAPAVRSYIENNFFKKEKYTKIYYCGPMFRYERPQAGRYRQFHQIGVEYFGNAHPFSDAEVISMGVHLFDELGLADLQVCINSVGCHVCRPVIEQRLKQFLGASVKFLCGDCQNRMEKNPLRVMDCKNPNCQNHFTGLPDIQESLCQECSDHFSGVLEYLDALGIQFTIEPKLVRGLDYYVRTTFEIVSNQLGAQNALCGGGRYDLLVEQLDGPPTPAVGFAFGVERAVMVLKELSDIIKKKETLVYMAAMGLEQQKKCFYLMNELRRKGIMCEMDCTVNELKGHLKRADKMQARYTLIYGDEEAEKNIIIVKDMIQRKQIEIPFDTIVNFFEHENNI